ncbi:MAG: thioredoxin family protein [Lysobacter sp.]|nr:thioredoxin family protein [Lysobacter sp.]
MDDTSVPEFFHHFPMQRVHAGDLDHVLADDGRLRILFLWGRDCPNCDIAKRQMLATPDAFAWPDVDWLHDNVYADPRMGTRFGLHGIPTFLVFRGARKLGRITPWPGTAPFVEAIERLRMEAPAG